MKRNTLNFEARLKAAGLATQNKAAIEQMSLEGAAQFLTEKLANGVHLTAINTANILKTLGIETRTQAAKRAAKEAHESKPTVARLSYFYNTLSNDLVDLAGSLIQGLESVANLYNRLGEKSPEPLIDAFKGLEWFREKYGEVEAE